MVIVKAIIKSIFDYIFVHAMPGFYFNIYKLPLVKSEI